MWVGRDESKRQGLNLSGSWQQGHSALTIPRRVFKSSAKDSTRRSIGIAFQIVPPDSDLEAFSHNPTHGSFAPLAFQPSAMTNCANQRFLSY
ncbi:senescence-associated protein, putative [Medicago truncatula]|uniref:Senescence-associated protein, putative n=1 Tax=Medicago truncatula TaxID=3880 RepID=A0A072TJH8_MEDTR|nr:senescence-associated protein, putative [Medicago truncatula]